MARKTEAESHWVGTHLTVRIFGNVETAPPQLTASRVATAGGRSRSLIRLGAMVSVGLADHPIGPRRSRRAVTCFDSRAMPNWSQNWSRKLR